MFRLCEGSVRTDDYTQHYTLCYDPQSRMLSLKVISEGEIMVRQFLRKKRRRWELQNTLTFDAETFVRTGEVKVHRLFTQLLDDVDSQLLLLEPSINEVRKLRKDPAFVACVLMM